MKKDNHTDCAASSPKPYALYVHGLGSGARTRTMKQLPEYLPYFEWIVVEVAEDAEEAVEKIDLYVRQYHPEVLMGTSLGGFYIFYADAPDAVKIICNPAMNIDELIRTKIGFGEHHYFVKRENGQKTYTLDAVVCRRFAEFRMTHFPISGRANYAFFGDSDELIGPIDTLKNMAVVSAADYSIFVECDGGHRIGETTLQLVNRKLFEKNAYICKNKTKTDMKADYHYTEQVLQQLGYSPEDIADIVKTIEAGKFSYMPKKGYDNGNSQWEDSTVKGIDIPTMWLPDNGENKKTILLLAQDPLRKEAYWEFCTNQSIDKVSNVIIGTPYALHINAERSEKEKTIKKKVETECRNIS